jgi:phage-related holin
MALIYIPFMVKSLNAYKSVENPKYKKAFMSLAIMSLSLILVLVNQLIDRLFMIFLGIAGYTIFYFLAWACAIIAALSAYLGYIRPKTREE